MLLLQLYARDSIAAFLLKASVVWIEPRVLCVSCINEYKPIKIVPTDHMGSQVSGWKSLILRHNLVSISNLPFGVIILMDGGLNGYAAGKVRTPW